VSFGDWYPLTEAGVDGAPRGPAAVQLRRALGLVRYPRGRSAMVYYFYAADDAARALTTLFADELATPGARGYGALWFRFSVEENAREGLEALYHEFSRRFGAPPVLHGADEAHDGG
jgi:hypothetical protein